MRNFFYRKEARILSALIQGLLAGLIVFCLVNIQSWTDGSYDLNRLNRPFEETQIFCRTIQKAIQDKITYVQNEELFETDGEYDPDKLIDIHLYSAGTQDEMSQNINTSFTIESLIDFAGEDADAMDARVRQLAEDGDDEEAGQTLAAEAELLETILPISGTTLADYARLTSASASSLPEYYRNLVETARDLAARYKTYSRAKEEPEDPCNPKAPGNILYYVANTATGQIYTNMEAITLGEAENAISADESMTCLFEGERRFNIMVSSADHVYNDTLSDWFVRNRFVGNGEEVLIAADLSYTVRDDLRTARDTYVQQKPWIMASIVLLGISLTLIIAMIALSIAVTGHDRVNDPPRLQIVDAIPTDLWVIMGTVIGILLWVVGRFIIRWKYGSQQVPTSMAILGAIEYAVVMTELLGLIRRIKVGTIWENSVAFAVFMGSRQVHSARRSSRRLLITFAGYMLLNLIFLIVGGLPGIVMMLALNLAVLMYMMRDTVGNQNVREGLKQISTGKLDYKINTSVLAGESRDMALAVNEMGDGLQQAVESMLHSERLRAELITNVSHDLKTPLTSIVNYVDLLKRENLDNEKAREYVEVLEHKSARLRQLTEDLIEVSKISSGNIELHPTRLQLQMFLDQACGELEDRLDERGLHVKFDMPRKSIFVEADGKQLWRVFENLLSNIAKYAKADTEVQIQLTEMDGIAEIVFRNQSASKITVSAKDLEERFIRGDASRSGVEGSGLGLSIAGSLTRLIGGTFHISVEEDQFEAHLVFPVMEVPEK